MWKDAMAYIGEGLAWTFSEHTTFDKGFTPSLRTFEECLPFHGLNPTFFNFIRTCLPLFS